MISAARKKTHVKKGDQVTVITGAHKGATGKVMTVLTKKDQVIVEGVRMIKKHAPKSQDRPQGGIIEREGPAPHLQRQEGRRRVRRGSEGRPQVSQDRERRLTPGVVQAHSLPR